MYELFNSNANPDQNNISTLLGVTVSGDIRRVLVDEDGALLVSGGGGGSVAIYDEGVLINEKVLKLNFKGADIQAVQNLVDPNEVFIYSPPSQYSSHYNNVDGTSSALVPSITSTSRYVATPTAEGVPFKLGAWLGGTLRPCINNGTISYQPANPCSILDNTSTTFTATIYDADGVAILATNQVTLTGNLDVTLNNIRIQVTGFVAETGKFKANISTSITMNSILPNGGRFNVKLEHNNGVEGIFTKLDGPFFYDTNNNLSSIASTSFAETVGLVVTKQISGVYYYTTNSQFTVGVNSINNINDRSFPALQVYLEGADYGLPALSTGRTGLTDWTDIYNNTNASYTKTDWAITTLNFYAETTTGNVSSRTQDWVAGSWVGSLNKNILVDTYTDNSTRIYEDFRNEVWRLKTDSTAWDNTQNLVTYDDGVGLQLNNSRLIYPLKNYTTFNPGLALQPDYSITSGNKTYKRQFTHPTIDQSNGLFTFTDFNWTESSLTAGGSGDLILDISIDGTTWYSLNSDYAGGALLPGAGCRINSDTNTLAINSKIEFTFGLGLFSKVVFLRVTYSGNAEGQALYCGSISLAWA